MCLAVDNLQRADLDPSLIAFSSALLLNTHNRNNRALREKLGGLYTELVHERRLIREKYVLTHMMVPLPYRLVRTSPTVQPLVRPR